VNSDVLTDEAPVRLDAAVADTTPPKPDPDQAWKALSLVNDWIKHADTKIAATLAAAAACAVALFNLVSHEAKPNCLLLAAASVCGALLFWTVGCALAVLVPRLTIGRRSDPIVYDNLLYYHHIANAYPKAKKDAYVHELANLTMDDQALTKHIAEQVHANATVANNKFKWVNRAIWALAFAIVFLSFAAAAAAWK
jgi:hypothetical protein